MRFWHLALCSGLMACNSPPIELPENAIVTASLCADSYIHAFPSLEPRIAALSWQSRSTLSMTPDHLRFLPQTDSDPERVLRWKHAKLITSAGGNGEIDLKWGEDFETVWSNLELLSRELNVSNPTQELKKRLHDLPRLQDKPAILYLDRSGASAGPGTFVDAVIQAAGGKNIIQTQGWQSLDTETLIRLTPDIVLTSFMGSNYAGVNDRAFRHKALVYKIGSVPQIDIPGKYWPCAGPGLVDAAESLSAALATL